MRRAHAEALALRFSGTVAARQAFPPFRRRFAGLTRGTHSRPKAVIGALRRRLRHREVSSTAGFCGELSESINSRSMTTDVSIWPRTWRRSATWRRTLIDHRRGRERGPSTARHRTVCRRAGYGVRLRATSRARSDWRSCSLARNFVCLKRSKEAERSARPCSAASASTRSVPKTSRPRRWASRRPSRSSRSSASADSSSARRDGGELSGVEPLIDRNEVVGRVLDVDPVRPARDPLLHDHWPLFSTEFSDDGWRHDHPAVHGRQNMRVLDKDQIP